MKAGAKNMLVIIQLSRESAQGVPGGCWEGYEELVLMRELALPLWPFARAKRMRDLKNASVLIIFLLFSSINT